MALYSELARYYDRIYSFKDYGEEVRRLHRIALGALARPGRTLLDVGCGTGRHLEHFRRWYDVAGVDLSPSMLRVARRRLGADVPLQLGDMRSFDTGHRYDVLVCLFSAFGYMATRADRDRAAATFFRHLEPGGVALVEGWILPERWKVGRPIHLLSYSDPTTAIARISRGSLRGGWTTIDMEYYVAEAGHATRRFRERHHQPLLPAAELLGSFRRAGFRARVLRRGPYRDRGLYVLRRPVTPPPVKPM